MAGWYPQEAYLYLKENSGGGMDGGGQYKRGGGLGGGEGRETLVWSKKNKKTSF